VADRGTELIVTFAPLSVGSTPENFCTGELGDSILMTVPLIDDKVRMELIRGGSAFTSRLQGYVHEGQMADWHDAGGGSHCCR